MRKLKPVLMHRMAIAAALLLAAAGAQAQSSVRLYGLMDLSVGSTKAPGGQAATSLDSGKLSTSFWGMSGTEDLGDGLAAVFKLEGFLRADSGDLGRFNGDPVFARNAYVGLSDARYGTLTLGRNTTPLFVATLSYNALGDSFGYSPAIRHYFTSGTVTGDSGWSQSALYSSPTFGGFRFGLASAGRTGSGVTSNGDNWSANVSYSGGPLSGSLVVQDVRKDGATPTADTRTAQLGAAYDLQVAKVYAQYGQVQNHTSPDTYRISGLGVRAPFGVGAVVAQWGRVDGDKSGDDRQTLTLGYTHLLSKNTELYGMLMKDKQEGKSDGRGYSAGMRLRF